MKSLNSVIVFFAILAIIGAGIFFYPGSPYYYKKTVVVQQQQIDEQQATDTSDLSSSDEEQPSPDEMMEMEEDSGDALDADETSSSSEMSDQTETDMASDFEMDVKEMSLGSDDAPVTIYEYSSLSCGHCGAFHSDAYPQIKSDYIETGKAKLVMIDFPLNLPAMQGAMLAHCLPDDQYFNFLQLLFTTQANWLSGDYEANLRQNAQLAGLSSDQIDACLSNTELEEKLLARMEDAQNKWNISSTPSFVINDGAEIIEGNRPFEAFETVLNRILDASDNNEE